MCACVAENTASGPVFFFSSRGKIREALQWDFQSVGGRVRVELGHHEDEFTAAGPRLQLQPPGGNASRIL